MVKRYLESHAGALILALIIWGILLFSSYYILYNYCLPLKLFGPNRWAFITVVLSSAIGTLVYYTLAKRSQLDEIRLEYRSGLILGFTAITGTPFVFEDFDMAIKVASAFATLFFAGLMIASIMLFGILRDTRQSCQLFQQQAEKSGNQPLAQPSQPNHQLQSLSLDLSLLPLPQPGQKLVIEVEGKHITVIVQHIDNSN